MDLQAQVLRVEKYIQSIALPETEEWVSRNEQIKEWNTKQRGRLAMAMGDGNEALLQEALGGLAKAQERVNTLIAEARRAQHPSPDDWPLEYFKWMLVKYIHFSSALGDFLLFPRMPRTVPRIPGVHHWYTADELMVISSSAEVMETIKLFGILPSRPEQANAATNPPPRDENDLHLDFTVDPHTIKAIRGNLVNRRRWQ